MGIYVCHHGHMANHPNGHPWPNGHAFWPHWHLLGRHGAIRYHEPPRPTTHRNAVFALNAPISADFGIFLSGRGFRHHAKSSASCIVTIRRHSWPSCLANAVAKSTAWESVKGPLWIGVLTGLNRGNGAIRGFPHRIPYHVGRCRSHRRILHSHRRCRLLPATSWAHHAHQQG